MEYLADRDTPIQAEGTSLEVSGVNQLLALAQELGVRGTKGVVRPEATQRETVEPSLGRSGSRNRREGAGFKVSLSDAANRLAEELSTESTLSANQSIPTATRTTDSMREIESENTGLPPLAQGYDTFRRNTGIAAYERNARAIPGERVRVIA